MTLLPLKFSEIRPPWFDAFFICGPPMQCKNDKQWGVPFFCLTATAAPHLLRAIYVLKIGIETLKQNVACALLSLALVEENKSSIGASGAIPPLVSLLMDNSSREKKDPLTTLYKLCSLKQNKEQAVSSDAVRPLVEFVVKTIVDR
ncbi:hypothetical protein PIB30_050627 [Stylosanthes scabra]|uniref:Uncharacterized protein n=1 Tax=Stylosanthes scabra TaxID=79078 RepID=A0ABU6RIG2_9FABA|nr:hypothetical protein [Stylosanthes scabra]